MSSPYRHRAQIIGSPPVTSAASNASAGARPAIAATSARFSGPLSAARPAGGTDGRATIEQLHQALAFLLAIDPEAFDIAFTGIADAATEPDEDERAESLCSRCGAPVAIFPDFGPDWLHYRGDPAVTGNHEPYDPGHAPQVAWFDLNDMSDEF